MKYRTLGQGLKVSALGIGCMPMVRGGNIIYGGTATAGESIATIHRAIDLGINFFDTAEMYGPFSNEELVGEAIRGKREGWSSPPSSRSNGTAPPRSGSTAARPMRVAPAKARFAGSESTRSTCSTSIGSIPRRRSRRRSAA